MQPEEYERVYALEDSHWWYVGMRDISLSLLDSTNAKAGRGLIVLDAGCGTGGMLPDLAKYGRVLGCDISPHALALSQKRGETSLCQSSVENLPFAEGSFDLVTSFDVLYHLQVKEDQRALAEYYRILKKGGRLLLRVAAYDWLRGRHDLAIHTRHRYTAPELAKKMAQAGFTLERLTYANTFLFPLAVMKRLGEWITKSQEPRSDVQPVPRWANRLLAEVLYLEKKWLRRFDLPFGLSVIAMGRK
ncbi:MAG: class I SAM-dependent methyltransferase [Chloroflexi bacterium]|nr:class I SAM-dependent methyltransferase [Chloroflexota bacterium]